ncbi:EpsG family protein [Clostridium baratii]|uniref:EpsG family protein n=1 Tax=Clostridium baratii TaxID=1561 RepID=UPI003D32FE8B
MLIYISIFIVLILFSMINLYIKKENLKFVYIAFGVFITLFTATRDNIGGSDYFVYKDYFNNITNIFNLQGYDYFIKYEIGYKYLNALIKCFTNNYIWLFFIIAMITIPIILKLNYQYCKYPFFTMAFYMYKTFFYTNFIAMRQSIALTIFIVAFKYIINGDFKKYAFSIIIASLFHSSAIVLLPLYFVRKIKFYKLSFIQIILIGGIILIFSNSIIDILEVLLKLFGFSQNIIIKISNIKSSVGINLHVFEMIFIYFIFRKTYKINNKKDEVVINIFILYCILTIAFSMQVIFIRIAMYFYFIIMIFISRSLENIKDLKYKQLLIYILAILFLLGYIKYIIQFDNGGLLPYKSVISLGGY